eukprot:8833600-Pyramimonas_sp.AAC.1
MKRSRTRKCPCGPGRWLPILRASCKPAAAFLLGPGALGEISRAERSTPKGSGAVSASAALKQRQNIVCTLRDRNGCKGGLKNMCISYTRVCGSRVLPGPIGPWVHRCHQDPGCIQSPPPRFHGRHQ